MRFQLIALRYKGFELVSFLCSCTDSKHQKIIYEIKGLLLVWCSRILFKCSWYSNSSNDLRNNERMSYPWGYWATKPGLLSWAVGWHHGGKEAIGCTPEDWQGQVQSVCTCQVDSSSPTRSDALGSKDFQGCHYFRPFRHPCLSFDQSLMAWS